MLLDHPKLEGADLSSLQCFWYGAAPISVARLTEALEKIGPMAQLFGQTEAPMMISMMPPEDHYNADGSIATGRLSSAGRVGPLVQVGIMDGDGNLMPVRERGEIVVRGSLVMDGYYKNAEATAEASLHGWHHTGDIGYLDADNFLFIVDRAKDMIITGGFNVYSVEVENALQAHETIQDCAVIGLPDEEVGRTRCRCGAAESRTHSRCRCGIGFRKAAGRSVKTPKQIEVWDDLPRSKSARY